MIFPSLKIPAESKSFLWTFPECPVRIHVHFQFIDRLQAEILNPAPADREVGGLLIGDESPGGDIEVYDYYRLPPASETVANFVVCSEALTRAIQTWSAPHRRVIGFYRTHLESRVRLRPEDLECIRAKFNHPLNVFLLVRPHDGRASAGFFFWQGTSVVGGLTFPFSSSELSGPGWTTLVGGSPNEDRRPAPLERLRDTAAPASRTKTIGLLVAVAFLIALAFILRVFSPAPVPPQTLGLRIERALLGVVVAWNPAAPEIAAARDADLLVWDGSSPPVFVRLTGDQLRSGRTFLTSLSDRVQVRLDVIGPAGAARTETAVSVAPASQPGPSRSPAAPTTASIPRQQASRTAAPPPNAAVAAQQSQEARVDSVPRPAPIPDAASVTEPPQPLAAPSDAGKSAEDVFEPAVPIRETRPDVPSEFKSLVQSDNVVEVQVHIDASGKVTEARPAMLKGPVAGQLTQTAVNAALSWQFRPAMQRGEPVPSEKNLEFLFRPPSR